MKRDIDTLLKQALTPTDEPDFWLNQNILRQVKETKMYRKKEGRIQAAALVAAAVVLGAGCVTAYGAWKYLAPEKAAEKLNDAKLADAFQGKDAAAINEIQTIGKYRVTLLGIVSGKDISSAQYKPIRYGETIDDRTYALIAIEYADGTPMPDTSDLYENNLSFFVSPLIKGYDPSWYNMMTMSGSCSAFTENGILYKMAECNNVEMFADCGLYLCVSDSSLYDPQAYHYDEATGEISRNEDYDGLNALFVLPIDASKADPAAAAEYLKSLEDKYGEFHAE